MSSRALFVYGTLRRGCDNPYARLLDGSAEFVGPATIQARLYRVSYTVEPYPGIRLQPEAEDRVVGDVFQLRNPQTLATLDQYEGSAEYQRVLATAVLENGDPVQCWVYEYIGPVTEDRRIVSGDWLRQQPG